MDRDEFRRQAMTNEKFDRMLAEIRNEQVDDRVVAQAGERVRKSIAGAEPEMNLAAHTLRRCEDFQGLIPAYLRKQLALARALLFEDHVHSCVACRHALERARDGERQQVWKLETKRARSSGWRWGMMAAGVAAVIVAAFAFSNGMLTGQRAVRAEVQAVDGPLYAVEGGDVHLVRAGYQIRN